LTIIAPDPARTIYLEAEYRLAEDGSEDALCAGDHSRSIRDERRLYQIIDGHMYYPVEPAPAPPIWRGRDVYAGRSHAS